VIRAALASDAAALSELVTQLGYPAPPEELARRLALLTELSKAIALVATDGEKVTGIATCHIIRSINSTDPIAQLTTLVVHERVRGTGVGSKLVAAVETYAIENGCEKISVTSGIQREGTHKFYQRIGYDLTGLRFAKALPAKT
jgi:GNAT superfamily N-acetyltransferase